MPLHRVPTYNRLSGGTIATKPQQPPPDFPVVWVDDAELPKAQPAILKGLIDPGAFVIVYGPSGSGKSFFTADIAQNVATGTQWRGRRTHSCLVVYVAAEAGTSILKRFIAWRDNQLGEARPKVPLAILTRGPNLIGDVDREKLIFQLKNLIAQSGLPLGLVIFDTLSRSMHGGDENKAEDMTRVIAAADAIRDDFGAATLFVHHTGKDQTNGPRGHSALFAAADLVILVDNHCGTVQKVRDGVAGERFPFRLEPVTLGEDYEGDPITTCLIQESDQGQQAQRKPPTAKNQKIVFIQIQTLVEERGQLMPGTSAIPQGVKAISFEALVERCATKMPGLPLFRVRAKVSDAVSSLQATGHLGVQNDLVWLSK